MITPAQLKLRVSLVLKNERPVRVARGQMLWDYEPEYRLTWTDSERITHFCKVPPAPIPNDYAPITFCRTPVDSLDIHLVDSLDLGGTNCVGCFRGDTTRQNAASIDMSFLTKLRPAPVRRSRSRKRIAGLVAGFLVALIGAAEYYIFSASTAEPVAVAAPGAPPIMHPVVVDHEPFDGVGEEF